LPLGGSDVFHFLEVLAQACDALLDAAAVDLELTLAITAHADAAFLPREVRPKSREPRQDVLQLRHLDLHFPLPRPRALGEDVEDERGAVEHFAVEYFLQVLGLRRAQFVIENDRVHFALFAKFSNLRRLAFADEGGHVWAAKFLGSFADDFCARGPGQLGEFLHRFRDLDAAALLEFRAHKEDALNFPSLFRE